VSGHLKKSMIEEKKWEKTR